MSENEDTNVRQVLETVTSTIRSMVQLVDTAVASIKNHNEAIDGLAKVTQDQDARIRTLQSQVYALKEENESLKRGLENLGTTVGNLCKSYMLHSHEAGNA